MQNNIKLPLFAAIFFAYHSHSIWIENLIHFKSHTHRIGYVYSIIFVILLWMNLYSTWLKKAHVQQSVSKICCYSKLLLLPFLQIQNEECLFYCYCFVCVVYISLFLWSRCVFTQSEIVYQTKPNKRFIWNESAIKQPNRTKTHKTHTMHIHKTYLEALCSLWNDKRY